MAGQNVRKYYQLRLPSDPSKDYYFILRDTANNEAVLIEYGFIDNDDDLKKLNNDLDNLSESVVKSIAEYLNVKYVPVITDTDNYYIVQKGDTLWSVARKYGITVSELKELNNKSSNLLSIGEYLKINKDTLEPNIYIVQKGDTLYSIARKYNTTVDNLKNINNLTSNTLSIGQNLVIPSNSLEKIIYTVQKGDTLYSIAKKYNTSVDKIKNINKLITNILSIGQKLIIS